VEEANDKVQRSQKNLKEFKKTFQKYKAALSTYFTEEKKPKTWDFQEVLIFKRYDSFLGRLNTICEFFNTALQFQKLEKVEVGGIRGKLLTSHVKKIFVEFGELYQTFGMRTYDALNPKDKKFLRDYEKFNSKLFNLDRKLGAILSRAFEDCTESQSVFRLLHVFGGLVDRKLIALELSDKMPVLVQMLNTEMDEARTIFRKQEMRIANTGKALTDRNMPPITGQLKFAKHLREKIVASIKDFKSLSHPICYSEGANQAPCQSLPPWFSHDPVICHITVFIILKP
jgi:dynein heavy chain